jgi:hypothetical protein
VSYRTERATRLCAEVRKPATGNVARSSPDGDYVTDATHALLTAFERSAERSGQGVVLSDGDGY